MNKYKNNELNAQDVIKKNEEKKQKAKTEQAKAKQEKTEQAHKEKTPVHPKIAKAKAKNKTKDNKSSKTRSSDDSVATKLKAGIAASAAGVGNFAKDTAQKAKDVAENIKAKVTKKDFKKDGNTVNAQDKSKKTGKHGSKHGGKKKHRVLKGVLIAFGVCVLAFGGYAIYCIASAPSINTDDLYSHLQVSSVMYDDNGKPASSVFTGENRSLVEYKEIPKNLINAFVAIEDKTFWNHNGFNITRIFGAIKDSIFGGGSISGTSTITQQLARNIYLPDEKSERSLRRKIVEAYYTMVLESNLSKEEIITAYLNTISLGFHSYGVQAASRAYFNCDVSNLTLEQCAALAALPQAPTKYALVIECKNNELSKEDVIIKKGSSTSFILNDVSKDRRETCLDLMLEQELITQEEHDKAKAVPLEQMLNVNTSALSEHKANYFGEYIVEKIIADLQEEGYSYDAAQKKVYSGGLKIYTTMDSQAQEVMEKEFDNPDNFPGVSDYKSDSDNNITDEDGNILLYDYDKLFDSDGNYKFKDDEYKFNDDGSLTLFYGKRLNIYKTSVEGGIEYSVEFKNMYTIENGRFFSIAGGFINIPAKYKKVDNDMNVIISADFFKDYPDFFNKDNGLSIAQDTYKLNQKVVQPQGAMVIRDVTNGQIKAMVGGRELAGEQLFNRATSPRQPGSSIKPISVYAPALQYSVDALNNGQKSLEFVDPGGTGQGAKWWGNFLTAASAVVDEKMTVQGKVWPQNVTKSYSGVISMREAMKNSVNVSAVKLFQQIGADYSSQQVQKFGITTLETDSGAEVNDMNAAALALGGLSKGVTPAEMSNAFTAFVNGGKIFDDTCYTKVEDAEGNTILTKKAPESKQAIDPGVAYITRDMLFGVVDGGTGSQASLSGTKVGGKTGTTSDEYDIWFNGFTPTYSASLWIGNDMNMQLSSMSDYAARLWSNIMGQIDKSSQGSYSDSPSNVITQEVDAYSGGLASGGNTKSEYFIKGTEPTEKISIGSFDTDKEDEDKNKNSSNEPTVDICSETGFYATPSCPSRTTVKLADSDNSKRYYCNKHNPDKQKYPVSPDTAMMNNEINERRKDKYCAA